MTVLRIAFFSTVDGLGTGEEDPISSTTLAVTSSATSGGSQPVVPAQGASSGGIWKTAVMSASDAPIYVDIGAAPDPTVDPRHLVIPGQTVRVHVQAGHQISAILASDVTLPSSGGSSAGLPTSLGQKTAANSTSVVLSSDGPFATNFGLQADAAQTDPTQSASFMSFVKGLFTGIILKAGSAIIGKVGIDQTTPGTTDSVSVKSAGYTAPLTITRPANAAAYTANDNIGGALDFASIGPSGKDIIITSAELEIDVAALPSGMTSFRLYFYNVTPPSALADNAAWDIPSGDRASFLGYIDLGTPVDLGSTLYCRADAINAQFKLLGADLFGYLVTNGGFTPAGNSEVYKVTLHAVAP